jgi:hypothetical protein
MQTTERPVVFGESYSVYARAVRLALAEKGVSYELVPVDIFAPGEPPREHRRDTPSKKSGPRARRISPLRGGGHLTVCGRGFPDLGYNRKTHVVAPE